MANLQFEKNKKSKNQEVLDIFGTNNIETYDFVFNNCVNVCYMFDLVLDKKLIIK